RSHRDHAVQVPGHRRRGPRVGALPLRASERRGRRHAGRVLVTLAAPTIDEIRRARDRITPGALRTPLVRLETVDAISVQLKLANPQPIGSFKIRGALSRLRAASADDVRHGVYTASAGNMAQGVAYAAQLLGVPARVFVPDTAPKAKTDAVERL